MAQNVNLKLLSKQIKKVATVCDNQELTSKEKEALEGVLCLLESIYDGIADHGQITLNS